MKIVFFFLSASALFTAAAIPMQPSQGSSSVPDVPLGPNHVPKVDLGYRPISKKDRTATENVITNHYNSLEPGNEHKTARLAYAHRGWFDGVGPDNQHKQYLDFDYHRGDTPDSAKIGQSVTISRDRPPPGPHFSHAVPKEHKPEIAKEIVKCFKALPPDQAKRVRSMKAHEGWGDGPGLREQTQFTFHHGAIPLVHNTLWNPTTIYRPMSFLIDDAVPKEEIPGIKKRVREEHENLDENDPRKQANYGVVTRGSADRMMGMTLYKVKDKLSDNAEENFKRIDEFPFALGKVKKSKASSSSSVGSAT